MVKIAVIGCGYWGPNLIRNFSEIEGCQLAACCDLNKNRLDAIKGRYPLTELALDYRAVLSNPECDAVAIATAPETHFKIAQEAFLQRKHVLIEKPITFNVKEAQELIAISENAGRILMVGHTFEYNPAVIKAKEYINNGDLGQIYYITSRRLNLGIIRENINAMWSLAPHDISILNYLFGCLPESVRASGATLLRHGIEDIVFLYLEYPGNIIAHIQVSWLDPHKIREMVIVGSKKMVVYDDIDNEGKIKIYDKGVDRLADHNVFGEYQLKLRAGSLVIPKIELSEPLREECRHFIECILKNRPPKTDGKNGLGVVKVLEAAQKSLKNNGIPVKIR